MTSTIKVDNIQDQDGNNIINENSNTITIGASGDTVTLASGASQSGFGREGSVDWQTSSIKTGDFTAVSGEGYFVNTTSGTITVTLPSSPSGGAIVAVKDYAQTFQTNNCTIARNSSNIEGAAANVTLDGKAESVTFVYVDSTKGWVLVSESTSVYGPAFVSASGGTITTCGNFKIHTFTGPGTFTVCSAGNPAGSDTVEYVVVAGGGSGGGKISNSSGGGGGGAGGFRFASPSLAPLTYPAKPLAAPAGLPVSAQGYPITVGGGAPASPSSPFDSPGNSGSNSVFSTITSAGGGAGAGGGQAGQGSAGGSGGGQSLSPNHPCGTVYAGNTPPVSPPQGNPGGAAAPPGNHASGGGGAIAAGTATPGSTGGNGGAGAGVPTAFGSNGESCGSFRYYAGGGGGGGYNCGPNGTGGVGGGANAQSGGPATSANADVNTGGGGGGVGAPGVQSIGGTGGSGIVIIRYKYQ